MNAVPKGGICIDRVDSGYCITYHGWPATSPLITGETHLMPRVDYRELFQTGIIGLGLVGWMFFMIFKNLIFLAKRFKFDYWGNISVGFMGGFVVAISHSMIEPNFEGVQFSTLFWSMVGATFAMRNVLAVEGKSEKAASE